MKYNNIVEGRFISRPNRFIAYVDILGETCKVHVKNTGRCKELLTDHAKVYLEKSDNAERSTAYDLVAVEKNGRLINMDSNAPNTAVHEWLKKEIYFKNVSLIKPETTYGDSRFDFYIETTDGRRIFLEVKGVTLEEDNQVWFPDAPSDRAVKHLKELEASIQEGYEAYVLFVIQMKDVDAFSPNEDTHKEFADTLCKVARAGVHVLAYDCQVAKDSMELADPVPTFLHPFEKIAKPLLEWYGKGHRSLAWREDPTPYHVWVSEIMLQQTRVEAVKGYYDRFMSTLPTIYDLANAEEDVLLKLWEGLGYYNRVRNLQKAAQLVVEEYDGELPKDYVNLTSLPGIGSYTAGAIASIAYGEKLPAVDGNVLRVLSRLREDDRDILDAKVKKSIEEELGYYMPTEQAGNFNQALMELGAMICLPGGEPKCTECPWEQLCKAHASGHETDYPKKAPKKKRTIEDLTVLILQDEEKTALHKRPDNGLLAGLYELPNMKGHKSEKQVIQYLKKMGMETVRIERLVDAKHIFSHKEWHMIAYKVRVDELSALTKSGEAATYLFVDKKEAKETYAIPSAFAAYRDFV